MPQDCNIELTETTQEGIIVSIDDDDWGFVEGSYEVGDSILSVFPLGRFQWSVVVLPPFPNPVLIDSVNLLFQYQKRIRVIIV
jgi:regulation of enolase protein 1 (concanavalin A-like superfamily)